MSGVARGKQITIKVCAVLCLLLPSATAHILAYVKISEMLINDKKKSNFMSATLIYIGIHVLLCNFMNRQYVRRRHGTGGVKYIVNDSALQ